MRKRSLARISRLLSIAVLVMCSARLFGQLASPDSPSVNVFYKFPFDGIRNSGYSHGKIPSSELVQGADGNYYGITTNGGSGLCSDGFGVEGCGTIFKISQTGVQKVIYNFTVDTNTNTAVNGIYPIGGLVQGKDGNFYGTASAGGNPNAGGNGCILGCGTIFKITPSGILTLLHQFAGVGGTPAEGAGPTGRLILASDGKFYGTTYSGGSVRYGVGNQGTIFSITSSGAFTTLHTFDDVDALDGSSPYAGLTQGKDGSFYGTTYFGGTDGVGTVFRSSRLGVVTVLHSFRPATALELSRRSLSTGRACAGERRKFLRCGNRRRSLGRRLGNAVRGDPQRKLHQDPAV